MPAAKSVLKIKFVDFWFGFEPENNYFFRLLSISYHVVISEDPILIIHSCYGSEYLKYRCLRVFYSAENVRPDFTGSDYAITFDYNSNPRHFRLPLYALYIDQAGSIAQFTAKKTREMALEIWNSKKKFCCMVVSNGRSKKRLKFYEKLSKYKPIDSGGKILNNIGGPVKNKMDFISDYRFVLAFENYSHPGYTTEKLVEPLLTDSIPIYWGNPLVYKDFNPACFLNLDDAKSDEELIQEIVTVDNNAEKAVDMLVAARFNNDQIPDDICKERLSNFFNAIISSAGTAVPVSLTNQRYLHWYKIKSSYYLQRIKGILTRLFR